MRHSMQYGLRSRQAKAEAPGALASGLTAVIVILLWFYVTGAAIFIVGEVNSEVEQANRGGAVCAWCGNKMAVSPE